MGILVCLCVCVCCPCWGTGNPSTISLYSRHHLSQKEVEPLLLSALVNASIRKKNHDMRPRASVNGVRDKFNFLCPNLCPAKTAQRKANWWDSIPSFQPFRWITSNWKEPPSPTQDTHLSIPHPSIKSSKPRSVSEEMADLRQAERPKQKVAATGDGVLLSAANKSPTQHLTVQASSSGVIGVASESRTNLKCEPLDVFGCHCKVAMSFKESS